MGLGFFIAFPAAVCPSFMIVALFIHVFSIRDGNDEHRLGRIIDRIDDTEIADSISISSGESPLERLHVVARARIAFQSLETSGELACGRFIDALKKALGLARQDEPMHRGAPAATTSRARL